MCVFVLDTTRLFSAQGGFRTRPRSCEMRFHALPYFFNRQFIFCHIGPLLWDVSNTLRSRFRSLHLCFFLVVAANGPFYLHFLVLWLGRGRLQPRSEAAQNRCAGAGADRSGSLSTFVAPVVNLARRATSLFYCSLRE